MANEIVTQNQEAIATLVQKLKNRLIGFYDVPKDYRYQLPIVIAERELGMRKSLRRGYDIIRNNFFVEECFYRGICVEQSAVLVCFDEFHAYYDFLQGDIYDNACYYGYYFSQELIERYSIDVDKLNFKALICDTIDDFTIGLSREEHAQYQTREAHKKKIIRALEKLNACTTYDEFIKQMKLSLRLAGVSEEFLLSNFIFHDKKKAFDIVMEYLSHTCTFSFENKMCVVYDPQTVLAAYKNTYYAPSTVEKHRRFLKKLVAEMKKPAVGLWVNSYFDEYTHFFVCNISKRYKSGSEKIPLAELKRYFETFEELMKFLKNELADCDLSKAVLPNLDLSKYKIGNHVKLPIQYQKELTYSLKKLYDRKEDIFVINQDWKNEQGVSVKSYQHTFSQFFDFAYFLKGDLSGADLLFCDGLKNIHDFMGLNLDGARLQSGILDKLGIKYETAFDLSVETYQAIQQNEDETSAALLFDRGRLNLDEFFKFHKIYYVSDLHLVHRLMNAQCKSANDVVCTIQRIIDVLLSGGNFGFDRSIMLIGGDTSSDFAIFKQFVSMLRKTLDDGKIRVKVIFILGNHELWDFPQSSFENIVARYKKVLAENGMFLLQNNILFKREPNIIDEISTEELEIMSSKELHDRLGEARVALFGGLAFAGYNEVFNANQCIYRDTINREQEIEETKKFEMLYHKVCDDLSDKRIIVFTHMPQKDWCANAKLQSGFVYVSGHTHRNYFYDDGDYRIYADNQIGYKHVNARLKHFYMDDDYDIFAEYEDGIYELNREQYINFYHGKNIGLTFNREFHKLFMLKKKGYYMFILQYPNGKLTILNGGALKSLKQRDVNYYFDRMDEVISYIRNPLDNFAEYQNQISNAIKTIGGSGTIHGSIVDIDFFNHIYVNPLDFTITPYSATDIINKVIFPDTPTLLQDNCPDLYKNYLKQIEGNSTFSLAKQGKTSVSAPQLYLDTDIYRASREIKKMQKLRSNILSIWIEPSAKKIDD